MAMILGGRLAYIVPDAREDSGRLLPTTILAWKKQQTVPTA
jgi:hypothetical protein